MQTVLTSQYQDMRTNGKLKWNDEIEIQGLMYLNHLKRFRTPSKNIRDQTTNMHY